MKKVSRISAGSILIAAGLSMMVISGFEVLAGRLIWIVLGIAGGALVTAGVRLISGDSLKRVLKDLLFVFVRTH